MKVLTKFLDIYCDDRPLLLGLSGGPDSIFLFHLLVESKHPFHVAHIDHGWRPESREQALDLAQMCERKGVPFHLKQLDPQKIEGNLEDECRKARLALFRELCEIHQLQGVILGHHADDQAETVLKRVFEGASLPKLEGLTSVREIQGVRLFRPLLRIRKAEIMKWLEERNLTFFLDSTNNDPHFLRGKMRQKIMPILSQEFGKEISTSLCRLGEATSELNDFLQTLLETYRTQVYRDEENVVLDLSVSFPKSRFLWKAVVRDFIEKQRLTASTSVVETIVSHLEKKSRRTKIKIGQKWVFVDQGKLVYSPEGACKNPCSKY